jgi:hypothetical protein
MSRRIDPIQKMKCAQEKNTPTRGLDLFQKTVLHGAIVEQCAYWQLLETIVADQVTCCYREQVRSGNRNRLQQHFAKESEQS